MLKLLTGSRCRLFEIFENTRLFEGTPSHRGLLSVADESKVWLKVPGAKRLEYFCPATKGSPRQLPFVECLASYARRICIRGIT